LLDAARRGVHHRVGARVEGFAAGEDAAQVLQRLVHRGARDVALLAARGLEGAHVALRHHAAHVFLGLAFTHTQ
jgi:hypothetical protein